MTFEDVLEIKNGKNQRAVEDPEGIYPIYGSGGVMGYANDFICRADTVIIGRKGNINKPIYVEEPFWNVDTAFGLEAKREILLPKYLYYFCQRFDFERLNKAVTIPSLTKADLLKIELELPTMDEQENIVEKLTTIEQIIDLRKQELQGLDNLIKARFVEMSTVWKCMEKPLLEYLESITYGFTNPMPDSEEGPWKITAKDVVNGRVNYDTARKTTKEAFDRLTDKSKPIIGDVLLTKDGTLGRTAIVENNNICVNQSVAVLRCNENVVPRFLSLLLQLPEYQREMTKNSGGGTIKHIYITKVDKMLVQIPNIDRQKEFLEFVAQVDKSKVAVQKALDKAQLLFDSLMQKYFG